MKIDFMAYREWSWTKRPIGMSDRDNLLDAALGLAGESLELLDATRGPGSPTVGRILDEAGDVLFYAAWMLDACEQFDVVPRRDDDHLDLPDVLAGEGGRDRDIRAAVRFGHVVEAVKKHVFHDRDLDVLIPDHIHRGLVLLHHLLLGYGSGLDVALHRNVAKLDARYPDGFVAIGGHEGEGGC